MAEVSAIVLAAGSGRRMGAGENKMFLPLSGKPILAHTLRLFQHIPDVGELVIVVRPEEEQRVRSIAESEGLRAPLSFVHGGPERADSVWEGLKRIRYPYVLVHDGARPLTPPECVAALLDNVRQTKAAILAVPVKDTIKVVNERGEVDYTPDRRLLWAAQTPQAFETGLLRAAYASLSSLEGMTDDACVVERYGHPVSVVPGSEDNLKITVPQDIERAETILRRRQREEHVSRGSRN